MGTQPTHNFKILKQWNFEVIQLIVNPTRMWLLIDVNDYEKFQYMQLRNIWLTLVHSVRSHGDSKNVEAF